MSCPHIWNIEKAKDRENEKVGDRLAKLNEKKSDKELEREIKKNQKGDEFRWKNNMTIYNTGGEKMKMLASFKVKMSGSEMKKANRNTSNKFFVSTKTFPP